jgi:hypothetical protein
MWQEGIISCLRAEVRWGTELERRRKYLVRQTARQIFWREHLNQKARKTQKETEELQGIPKKLRDIRDELKEIEKQEKAGTFRRELRTL